ncbi:MAG: radical SAM protein [Candidatus Lokiarchaeota archaeon]|nr:radical SAM protein [Candidatus Lokiarchaeota archaeon]
MNKNRIIKSIEGNFYLKRRGIPLGCQLCLRGVKGVLFLNGKCQKPDHCSWYCPISDKRRDKNISYINELRISEKEDIIKELDNINAKGISITGGEPLTKENISKTIEYIKFLKERKGNIFHIHLYSNGISFNKDLALKLAKAGLDEIRFHPAQDNWNCVRYALNSGISAGIEIPIIPNEQYLKYLEKLILYLDNIGAAFINLNEFEYCFPNSNSLKQRGFELEEGTIASVKNSQICALELINKISAQTKNLKLHFCSIIAKDYYQLKNRYLQRAKNIKKDYEEITDEGLLIYGIVEGNKNSLKILCDTIIKKFKLSENLINLIDNAIELPYYILIKDIILKEIKNLQLDAFIIETLPFREEEHRQITEKIPIELFKKEFNL